MLIWIYRLILAGFIIYETPYISPTNPCDGFSSWWLDITCQAEVIGTVPSDPPGCQDCTPRLTSDLPDWSLMTGTPTSGQ